MSEPRVFDPGQGPRALAYAFYREAEKPRWGLTARFDVAPLLACLPGWRAEQTGLASLTPFLAYHHAILVAANAVPALRQRLLPEGGAVEWASIDATPTVLRADDSFAVARLVYQRALADFAPAARAAIDTALQPDSPWGVRTAQSGEIHMTTLPWVHFSHFTHARRGGFDDATPSMACGGFEREGAHCWLPLNLEVHHALVDGVHVGRFVQRLQQLLAEPDQLLAG